MLKRQFGIFEKVFLYTLLFLFLSIAMTILVFAQQAEAFYNYLQIQHYTSVFEPLKTSLDQENSLEETAKEADAFHNKNQSFTFSIETKEGNTLYTTVNSNKSNTSEVQNIEVKSFAPNPSSKSQGDIVINLDDNLVVRMVSSIDNGTAYNQFIKKVVFILCLLFFASILGAFVFAKGITRPIKVLVDNTHKMSFLEDVSRPKTRRDEVGQLTRDVHNMYEKLKDTISKLQAEIIREKEMEENQRYFFSAASHELKTPISAMSALLEGMLAGIGDYDNHPKYLRKCLEMTRIQNKIVNEILEIVKLSDEKIVPLKQKVSLNKIISMLLQEYNTLANNKEQKIIVNVPETLLCHTDQKMFRTALSNIIMNAIQNSSNQEEIHIWTDEEDQDKVRLYILNTNATIDEATKLKLFEPFYRADQSRNNRDQGGGLGLTIVKKILDSLEINYALETQKSDVVFWMDLPICE